jgi:hypothetical protein
MKIFAKVFYLPLLFLVLSTFVYADNEPNDNCSQVETIGELNNISSTTSHTESGTGISTTDPYDYYQFTVASDGYVDLSFITNKTYNSIFIGSTCDGTQYYSNTTNDSTKYPPNFNVNNGDTIYIKVERRYETTMSYDLNIDFISTAPIPPMMGDVPDEVAIINLAYSLDISPYVTLTDGDSIISYTLSGDTLPTELSFNTTTGILFGTPITPATYNLSVTATDNDGESNSDSFTLTVTNLIESTGGRNFTQRTQYSLFGDVEVIGNTVLCILDSNGQCVEPSNSDSNADTNLKKAPQSYSTLTIPTNAVVEYARIYWQGRKAATTSDESWNETSKTAAGKIKIRKGSSGVFTELSADIKDFDSALSNNYVGTYSAGADASSIVDSSDVYYIDTSSFYTSTGETNQLSPDDGLGNYGAWVLVVVYSDPNEMEAKNITIFDGYKTVVSGDEIDISVSGFLTPKSGEVDSKTYVFAAEGDKYLKGTDDVIKMAGATYNTTLQELGTFDSRVNVPAIRNPDLDNNNGIDIHVYDTGTTSNGLNIITNYETGAKFQFTSDQDTYFPSLIIFSTELYSPKFCYDYSYKQQDVYFTEDNNGSLNPRISGNVEPNEPIEVTIFIRNLVDSDISVTDMFVDVFDINTSQAPYIPDSIKLAEIGDVVPVDIPDSLLDVDTNGDYVNNIEVGTIDTDAYFYLNYSLYPHVEDLNMSINVQARYNILVDGKYIPYTLQLGPQMSMCSSTNFTYLPTPGIFNVVHNDYYNFDLAGTNRFYNLPTQVTSRVGNFKVLALNPSDNDALLEDHNVIFAEVEMIDAGVFHDTDASCYQQDNSISDSIPIMFDSNVTSVLFNNTIVNSDFYTNARENTAFRISYYVRDSNDSTLPDYTKDGNSGNSADSYTANWSMNWLGDTCVIDMDSALDSNGNMSPMTTDDKVANWCQTSGSGMSEEQALACLKCVYGNQKNFVCSRDNFAIRPEAFLMNLGDQDQNNTTLQAPLTADFSGVVGATTNVLELASGYNYAIEVNATNHVNNVASPGYTRSFSDILLTNDDYAQYIWEPRLALTTAGCNDNGNMTTTMKFINGVVDTNSSTSQVGEYRLSLQDTLWTTVDNNSSYMTHHTGDYFLASTIRDCAFGSSNVFAVNATIDLSTVTALANSLTGCNINSSHTNLETSVRYNDFNVTSHPYEFNMAGITPSVGLTNTPLGTNSFIYMADMNQTQDNNMSFHLNGTISAVGFDNSVLSNFVDNCYAEPVSLTLTKTVAADNTLDYRYRFYNTDIVANDQNGSLNLATDMITLNTSDFNGSNNGSVNIRLNLNFDRNTSVRNPESIKYTTFDSNASSTFNADLIIKTLNGIRDLNNSSIAHYYGRTHAARQRFVGNQGVANIYYEVYCFDTISGNDCNKTLLQDGVNSRRTNDLRWYINTEHNTTNDGEVGLVTQQDGSALVGTTVPTLNTPAVSVLTYDETLGYPYKTTMENNASTWLIYNEDNINATTNEFSVEFEQIGGSWSGEHETNTTTNDTNVTRTNRRSMW